MEQVELSFDAGVTEQFGSVMEVARHMVAHATYPDGRRKQQKAVAYDLDVSPSHLSRQLAQGGDLHFPLERIDELIDSTNCHLLIHYLVEKHLHTPGDRREQALEEISRIIPQLQQLVASATAP